MNAAARHQESGGIISGLNYLDAPVKLEGATYTRRAIVLSIEDLKQAVEAPLTLQHEARAQMNLLKLDPIPELKLYREIATAVLRMDAALHLPKMNNPLDVSDAEPVFQPEKAIFDISSKPRLMSASLPGTHAIIAEPTGLSS